MEKYYTTKQVAKSIGVGYQTLLRWLYAKHLAEPERIYLGGASVRLWTKVDFQRARQYKKDGSAARRRRTGTGRPKKRR